MKLIDMKTDRVLAKGDDVVSFRGEHYILAGWEAPHKPASTGRVYLTDADGGEHSYYPGVINAAFVGGA